jgi:hypothetical protein
MCRLLTTEYSCGHKEVVSLACEFRDEGRVSLFLRRRRSCHKIVDRQTSIYHCNTCSSNKIATKIPAGQESTLNDDKAFALTDVMAILVRNELFLTKRSLREKSRPFSTPSHEDVELQCQINDVFLSRRYQRRCVDDDLRLAKFGHQYGIAEEAMDAHQRARNGLLLALAAQNKSENGDPATRRAEKKPVSSETSEKATQTECQILKINIRPLLPLCTMPQPLVSNKDREPVQSFDKPLRCPPVCKSLHEEPQLPRPGGTAAIEILPPRPSSPNPYSELRPCSHEFADEDIYDTFPSPPEILPVPLSSSVPLLPQHKVASQTDFPPISSMKILHILENIGRFYSSPERPTNAQVVDYVTEHSNYLREFLELPASITIEQVQNFIFEYRADTKFEELSDSSDDDDDNYGFLALESTKGREVLSQIREFLGMPPTRTPRDICSFIGYKFGSLVPFTANGTARNSLQIRSEIKRHGKCQKYGGAPRLLDHGLTRLASSDQHKVACGELLNAWLALKWDPLYNTTYEERSYFFHSDSDSDDDSSSESDDGDGFQKLRSEPATHLTRQWIRGKYTETAFSGISNRRTHFPHRFSNLRWVISYTETSALDHNNDLDSSPPEVEEGGGEGGGEGVVRRHYLTSQSGAGNSGSTEGRCLFSMGDLIGEYGEEDKGKEREEFGFF